MKKRHHVFSFDALDIQKQIARCKHKRGKELLDSRLHTTYLESYVDFKENKAMILTLDDVRSQKVIETIEEMVKNIMTQYPIRKVDVYGQKEAIKLFESGVPFPKSSIIDSTKRDENEIPIPRIFDADEGKEILKVNDEQKQMIEAMHDLKDNELNRLGFNTEVAHDVDEAGEIRLITQTIEEIKNSLVDY